MKYHIKTFGCQMNKNDSKRISSYLEKNNHTSVSEMKNADLIVINMCSIRQSAVDRIYGLIPKFKKIKKEKPELKIVLTGCTLKKDQKKLKENFDYILSKKALQQWNEFLQQEEWDYHPDPRNEKFNSKFNTDYLEINPKHKNSAKAYLPISTGCDNFCSFCVVPYTRGPEVSRAPKEIIKEAKELINEGVKELWLLGQNVNSYQHSLNGDEINFVDLVEKINNLKGDFWIKYTSSNPKDFTSGNIKRLSQFEKVTPYLNLPLQSGDNEVLKKMNRPYSIEDYKKTVKEFRDNFESLSLSTDIIVGFPGETKKQFNNTVEAFKDLNFDMAYIAKYSPRPQTEASELDDNVSEEEKERRAKILNKLLEKQALDFNKKLIGKRMKVIVLNQKDKLIGKNKYNKTVKFPGPEDLINNFVNVEITNASAWGLTGNLEQ
ncbi:MAG: tRNA (N6-isopentenyl adenosine(37)-C2)-methylthiotransferase MiaB [Candidatus Paceibacterota bacterium]